MDQGKLGDGATPGTWVMGTPVAPHANPGNWQGVPVDHVTSSSAGPSAGHCPSNTNHAMPPVPGASHFPSSTYGGGTGNPYVNISPFPHGSNASGNPYVNVSPVPTKSVWNILSVLSFCFESCGFLSFDCLAPLFQAHRRQSLRCLGGAGRNWKTPPERQGTSLAMSGTIVCFFAHYILVSCIKYNFCMVQISNMCYLPLGNHQSDQMYLFTCIYIEKL